MILFLDGVGTRLDSLFVRILDNLGRSVLLGCIRYGGVESDSLMFGVT